MDPNAGARPRPVSGLLTDFYELSMATVYHAESMNDEAVFELFFRELPRQRNFVIACGQEDCLRFLADFRLGDEELDYLASLERFPRAFLERLRRLGFSGDVWAVPEGSVVFPFEPVIQVRAPLIEAQLIETLLLNRIHSQSGLASKAARIVLAAEGRPVMDFGARKASGTDGALALARSAWIAGAAGTSNVEAGWRYGIPVLGTMAHSYIQAFDDETRAFERFIRQWPETTLLVDTWDTLQGVDRVIELVRSQGAERLPVRAIRLDSGDLGQLSRAARERLDAAGLQEIGIVASSGLDEYRIRELLDDGAPLDGFGVGTRLATLADAPDIDFAYKLAEYADQPRMKASTNKATYPGAKQVWRQQHRGRMQGDWISAVDEDPPRDAEPLLHPVMEGGELLPGAMPGLEDARARAARELAALPGALRALDRAEAGYPVAISEQLQRARAEGTSTP